MTEQAWIAAFFVAGMDELICPYAKHWSDTGLPALERVNPGLWMAYEVKNAMMACSKHAQSRDRLARARTLMHTSVENPSKIGAMGRARDSVANQSHFPHGVSKYKTTNKTFDVLKM